MCYTPAQEEFRLTAASAAVFHFWRPCRASPKATPFLTSFGGAPSGSSDSPDSRESNTTGAYRMPKSFRRNAYKKRGRGS